MDALTRIAVPLCLSLAACGEGSATTKGPSVASATTTVSVAFAKSTSTSTIGSAPTGTPTASASGPSALRTEVTRAVVSATIMRLEKPSIGFDAAGPASADKVAGFAVRRGSERALDAKDLQDLLDRLREESGFDDRTAKRCTMAHLVGMRLARKSDVVEIAIDFTCQKIFIVHGSPRAVHASHFDPSRAAFLALVKRALPGDAELGKLR